MYISLAINMAIYESSRAGKEVFLKDPGALTRRSADHGLAVSKVLHWFTSPEASPARNHRTR